MPQLPPDERKALEKHWRTPAGIAWPTIALSLAVLVGYVASTAAAVTGALSFAFAIPLNTLLAYLAFTPAHEAGHGNIAGSVKAARPLEAAIGWMMAGILSAPYPGLRYLHLQHHSHTNDPENDPDFRVAGSGFFRVALRCLTVERGYGAVVRRLLERNSRGMQEAAAQARPWTLFSIVLWGSAIYFGFWLSLLLLWSLPAVLGLGLLAFAFDWLPHHPHDNRERYRDTRVLLGAGLGTVLLGQNYHLIHHLYPRVPFYRYATCFGEVRPVLDAERSPIQVAWGRDALASPGGDVDRAAG